MSNETERQRPVWSPRVSKSRIARLYERCGQGIFDEELIDDVGFSLYARCKSILSATQRLCPSCETALHHMPEALECPGCGWECPRDAYRKSIKYKHLFAGGMKPFLEEFIQEFPAASSHQQRMILIDTLIHRCHWEFSGGGGRPAPGPPGSPPWPAPARGGRR